MSLFVLLILLVLRLCATDAVDLEVEGVCPAAFTPFDNDGNLNIDVIPAYAKYLKHNRIDAVLLASTSGEGPSLSLTERKQLLDAWLKEGKSLGIKVVMHVGGQSLPQVLEMAKYAETAGADAIMTLPELYYKPVTESAVVRYVGMVSDAAPKLPILYYHHPQMSGVQLNVVKFYKEATEKIPNFKGMKCDFTSALSILAADLVKHRQRLFMNNHLTEAANLFMGINSTMTAVGSVYPKLFLGIEEAIDKKNFALARQLQDELNARVAIITSAGEYIPYCKTAMEIVSGIRMGSTRDPLKTVTKDQMKALKASLMAIDAKYATE